MDWHVSAHNGLAALLPESRTDEQNNFGDSVSRLLGSAPHPIESSHLLSLIAEQGFLGIAIPEEYGGASTDDLGFGLVFATRAMAAGHTGLALRYGIHAWVVGPFLANYATAEQQARWLPEMVSGVCIASAVGLRGSTDDTIELRENDGEMYLTGRLYGIPGAAEAQLLLMAVKLPVPQVILVNASDVEVRRVDDESAAPGLASADISFDNLMVPAVSRVPSVSPRAIDSLWADHYLWLAALGVAGARAALQTTVRYVQERNVFGRPLADFENTRRTLAGVAVDLASAGALLEDCISARGHSAVTAAAAAAAALAATAVHRRSVDQGLQLHGGYGYMREYPISQAYADAMRLRLETDCAASWMDVAAILGLKTP
jgi:alkylation response protein AidB-like acyl-CoA dehydrogenase